MLRVEEASTTGGCAEVPTGMPDRCRPDEFVEADPQKTAFPVVPAAHLNDPAGWRAGVSAVSEFALGRSRTFVWSFPLHSLAPCRFGSYVVSR